MLLYKSKLRYFGSKVEVNITSLIYTYCANQEKGWRKSMQNYLGLLLSKKLLEALSFQGRVQLKAEIFLSIVF